MTLIDSNRKRNAPTCAIGGRLALLLFAVLGMDAEAFAASSYSSEPQIPLFIFREGASARDYSQIDSLDYLPPGVNWPYGLISRNGDTLFFGSQSYAVTNGRLTPKTISLGWGAVDRRNGKIDPTGEFVAFGTSVVVEPDDGNESEDVFILQFGGAQPIHISTFEQVKYPNGNSRALAVSPGGRYVAFSTTSTDGPAGPGAYVRDTLLNSTHALSLNAREIVHLGSSHAVLSYNEFNDRYVDYLPSLTGALRQRTAGTLEALSASGEWAAIVQGSETLIKSFLTGENWTLSVEVGKSTVHSVTDDGQRVLFVERFDDVDRYWYRIGIEDRAKGISYLSIGTERGVARATGMYSIPFAFMKADGKTVLFQASCGLRVGSVNNVFPCEGVRYYFLFGASTDSVFQSGFDQRNWEAPRGN